MSRFHGDGHVVQYLEKPEYLCRTFAGEHGETLLQYAVLICMPMYQNHKEWLPRISNDRAGKIRLGMDIAQALVRFEQEGVYHRDIKPGNIMLDSFGNFRLGDVGEAKLESEFTTLGFHDTRPYMAPEVYKQENESSKMRSDHRSDIYSLGMILYRLFNHHQFPFFTESGTLTEEATTSYRQYEKNTNWTAIPTLPTASAPVCCATTERNFLRLYRPILSWRRLFCAPAPTTKRIAIKRRRICMRRLTAVWMQRLPQSNIP